MSRSAFAADTMQVSPDLPLPAMVFAAATPGMLSVWGFGVIRHLGEFAGRPFEERLAVRDAHDVTPSPANPVLIRTHTPDSEFLPTAQMWSAPRFVFIGDPVKDISYETHVLGHEPIAAIRNATASLATIAGILDPELLVIHERDPATAAIEAIISTLGWDPADEIFAKILQDFGGEASGDSIAVVLNRMAWSETVTVSRSMNVAMPWSAIMAGALLPLYGEIDGPYPRPVVWAREALLDGGTGMLAPPIWIEATGAARVITFGPHFHLPAGAWRITATIGFSDDTEGSSYSIEVVAAGVRIARGRVRPTRGGTFEASFMFTHQDALIPIEARVSSDQGSIFGRLSIRQFVLQKIPDATS